MEKCKTTNEETLQVQKLHSAFAVHSAAILWSKLKSETWFHLEVLDFHMNFQWDLILSFIYAQRIEMALPKFWFPESMIVSTLKLPFILQGIILVYSVLSLQSW